MARVLLLVGLMVLAYGCSARAGVHADLYVAPNGDDSWSGRLPAPNRSRTDGPLADINAARLAVRVVRQAEPDRSITVLIRGGTYFLDDTVVFEAEDSGTSHSPTIYAAYPGETPVFSGGRRLGGWHKDSRGWWHTTVPEVRAGDWDFLSLYVNGQRRYRPRLPRTGCYRVADRVSPTDQKPDGFRFAADDIRTDWANLGDVEVQSTHLWNMSRMRTKSADAGVVRFTGGTYADASFGEYAPGHPYFVENVKEALGQPGEWYLDRPTGELIYVPKQGESTAGTEVIAPRLDFLLRLSGDWRNRRYVCDIVFRGLVFEHSNWCTPKEGYHFPQSDATIPGAILADGTRNCRFEGCRIRHTGGYGLQLGDSCKFNVIEGCELTDLGAGGIKIGFWAPREPRDDTTSHNLVRDNLIANGGRIQPGGTGILVGNSHHNRIARNDITDLYYIGISLGYNWDLTTTAHHNVVADNHIWNIGQGVLSDMGAIYTLGLSPGTVIRHNLIHDIRSQTYGGWGIYLDAESSEILVEDNIIYRAEGGSFHHNRGRGNVVRNNIFALGTDAQLTRSQGSEASSFDLERNVILWDGGQLLGSNWEDHNFRMDNNIYWNTGRRPITFCGLALDEWREKGLDQHSVIADPLFANPSDGDFRMSSDSPAMKVGFRPIAMTGFGTRTDSDALGMPAPRAFPDLSKALHPEYGYEDQPVGAKPHYADVHEENEQAVIRVSDEDAAMGKHSLKFTSDGRQKAPYNPHLIYGYTCSNGDVAVGFALKLQPGTGFLHEWRDFSRQDRPGPSISVDPSGCLSANGRQLQQVPTNQWIRLLIRCKVGAASAGDYALRVVLEDGTSREYRGLKYHPEFYKLMGLLFIADGSRPGVFYIDDLTAHK